MLLETAAATTLTSAMQKPLQDFYGLAKGKAKEALKKLTHISAINQIQSRALEIGTIRTISSRHPVSIRSIYYPARIKTEHSSMLVDHTNDLSNGANQHVVITGTVGQGKSVLLKYLCTREAETGAGLPIFIELRHTSEKASLKHLIHKQLAYLGFGDEIDDDLLTLLFSRRFVTLFLDGFDEVKKSVAESVRSDMQELSAKHPQLRMIVSSRPTALSRELDHLAGFSYLEINPLTQSDFRPFLKKIGADNETIERLIKAIEGSQLQIRELLTTPLMLTLVVTACGTRPTLPETLPDFYQALFGVMVSTHDETKPGYVREKASRLGNNQLEEIFKAFCFISKENAGTTSLAPREFTTCAIKAADATEIECSPEDLKSDLVDVVCLMAKDGLNTAFIHKSIQEYFASAFIADIDDDEVAKTIYSSIRYGWYLGWQQEIRFLKDLDSYRYKKFYLLPSINSILAEFSYNPSRKIGASIADIKNGIKKFNPSLRFDDERGELVLSLDVSIISKYGVRPHIFDVFRGVSNISDDAVKEQDKPGIILIFGEDENLLPIVNQANSLSKEILKTIRNNLHLIQKRKVELELNLSNRKKKLLSMVDIKKIRRKS